MHILYLKKSLQSKHTYRKTVAETYNRCHIGSQCTAQSFQPNTVSPDIAAPWGDIKGTHSDALIENKQQWWGTRIYYALFDAVNVLPHPPLLCLGTLGFAVRDYSRPQRQLLKQPITADSRLGWGEGPVVGVPNMQICAMTNTEMLPQNGKDKWALCCTVSSYCSNCLMLSILFPFIHWLKLGVFEIPSLFHTQGNEIQRMDFIFKCWSI